jgi:hypothetical protein
MSVKTARRCALVGPAYNAVTRNYTKDTKSTTHTKDARRILLGRTTQRDGIARREFFVESFFVIFVSSVELGATA